MFNVLCGHGCVESQHHVFLVAALWVQLPHVSAGVVSLYVCVCMQVRVYFVVLRGGPVGIQSDVWCSEERKRDDGSQREGETSTEYWLSLCLTWSVSVFVSEIWWPHQLSETCLSERVCFCVGVCVRVLVWESKSDDSGEVVSSNPLTKVYLCSVTVICLLFITILSNHIDFLN